MPALQHSLLLGSRRFPLTSMRSTWHGLCNASCTTNGRCVGSLSCSEVRGTVLSTPASNLLPQKALALLYRLCPVPCCGHAGVACHFCFNSGRARHVRFRSAAHSAACALCTVFCPQGVFEGKPVMRSQRKPEQIVGLRGIVHLVLPGTNPPTAPGQAPCVGQAPAHIFPAQGAAIDAVTGTLIVPEPEPEGTMARAGSQPPFPQMELSQAWLIRPAGLNAMAHPLAAPVPQAMQEDGCDAGGGIGQAEATRKAPGVVSAGLFSAGTPTVAAAGAAAAWRAGRVSDEQQMGKQHSSGLEGAVRPVQPTLPTQAVLHRTSDGNMSELSGISMATGGVIKRDDSLGSLSASLLEAAAAAAAGGIPFSAQGVHAQLVSSNAGVAGSVHASTGAPSEAGGHASTGPAAALASSIRMLRPKLASLKISSWRKPTPMTPSPTPTSALQPQVPPPAAVSGPLCVSLGHTPLISQQLSQSLGGDITHDGMQGQGLVLLRHSHASYTSSIHGSAVHAVSVPHASRPSESGLRVGSVTQRPLLTSSTGAAHAGSDRHVAGPMPVGAPTAQPRAAPGTLSLDGGLPAAGEPAHPQAAQAGSTNTNWWRSMSLMGPLSTITSARPASHGPTAQQAATASNPSFSVAGRAASSHQTGVPLPVLPPVPQAVQLATLQPSQQQQQHEQQLPRSSAPLAPRGGSLEEGRPSLDSVPFQPNRTTSMPLSALPVAPVPVPAAPTGPLLGSGASAPPPLAFPTSAGAGPFAAAAAFPTSAPTPVPVAVTPTVPLVSAGSSMLLLRMGSMPRGVPHGSTGTVSSGHQHLGSMGAQQPADVTASTADGEELGQSGAQFALRSATYSHAPAHAHMGRAGAVLSGESSPVQRSMHPAALHGSRRPPRAPGFPFGTSARSMRRAQVPVMVPAEHGADDVEGASDEEGTEGGGGPSGIGAGAAAAAAAAGAGRVLGKMLGMDGLPLAGSSGSVLPPSRPHHTLQLELKKAHAPALQRSQTVSRSIRAQQNMSRVLARMQAEDLGLSHPSQSDAEQADRASGGQQLSAAASGAATPYNPNLGLQGALSADGLRFADAGATGAATILAQGAGNLQAAGEIGSSRQGSAQLTSREADMETAACAGPQPLTRESINSVADGSSAQPARGMPKTASFPSLLSAAVTSAAAATSKRAGWRLNVFGLGSSGAAAPATTAQEGQGAATTPHTPGSPLLARQIRRGLTAGLEEEEMLGSGPGATLAAGVAVLPVTGVAAAGPTGQYAAGVAARVPAIGHTAHSFSSAGIAGAAATAAHGQGRAWPGPRLNLDVPEVAQPEFALGGPRAAGYPATPAPFHTPAHNFAPGKRPGSGMGVSPSPFTSATAAAYEAAASQGLVPAWGDTTWAAGAGAGAPGFGGAQGRLSPSLPVAAATPRSAASGLPQLPVATRRPLATIFSELDSNAVDAALAEIEGDKLPRSPINKPTRLGPAGQDQRPLSAASTPAAVPAEHAGVAAAVVNAFRGQWLPGRGFSSSVHGQAPPTGPGRAPSQGAVGVRGPVAVGAQLPATGASAAVASAPNSPWVGGSAVPRGSNRDSDVERPSSRGGGAPLDDAAPVTMLSRAATLGRQLGAVASGALYQVWGSSAAGGGSSYGAAQEQTLPVRTSAPLLHQQQPRAPLVPPQAQHPTQQQYVHQQQPLQPGAADTAMYAHTQQQPTHSYPARQSPGLPPWPQSPPLARQQQQRGQQLQPSTLATVSSEIRPAGATEPTTPTTPTAAINQSPNSSMATVRIIGSGSPGPLLWTASTPRQQGGGRSLDLTDSPGVAQFTLVTPQGHTGHAPSHTGGASSSFGAHHGHSASVGPVLVHSPSRPGLPQHQQQGYGPSGGQARQ